MLKMAMFSLFLLSGSAYPQVYTLLPPVAFADTETTTNVVLGADNNDGVERISLELECLTTPTNNVRHC